MANRNDKAGSPLHQTKLTEQDQNNQYEASWQQWMIFNHLLFEVIDAMQEEIIASKDGAPLNVHWQAFLHELYIRKPKLHTVIAHLLQEQKEEQST